LCRLDVTEGRTREKQRAGTPLESAAIKLSFVVTDPHEATGRDKRRGYDGHAVEVEKLSPMSPPRQG
jgi:hypothetical protein